MLDSNIERWQGYYNGSASMVTQIDYNHTTNQWKLFSSIFPWHTFTASGARTDYPWDLEWSCENPENTLIVLPPQD